MHKRSLSITSYILLLLIFTSAASGDESSILFEEAEQLEMSGEPLSAEIEYFDILENNISSYTSGNDKSKFKLAECEYLIEKILKLTEFTGDNAEALKSIIHLTTKYPDIPANLFSRIKLAEQTLNMRLGKISAAREISANLGFIDEVLLEIPKTEEVLPFKTISADSSLPLGIIAGKQNSETINAISIISTDKEREVTLNFGNSTPLTITLNSQKIFASAATRKARADQQKIGIKLQQGINILKFNCSNKEETELFIRLSQTDGSAINKGEIVFNNSEEFAKLSPAEILKLSKPETELYDIAINNGAEQILAEIVDIDRKDHRAAYYLGYIILQREALDGDLQPATELLLNAARYAPDNSMYLLALAQATDQSKRFKADQDNNIRRKSLEKAISLNPDNLIARIELAHYYLYSQNSPDRAEEYIKDALKINPITAQANILLYKIYSNRNWNAQALRIARELARRDPDIPQAQQTYAKALLANSTITEALHAFQAAYARNMLNQQTAKNIFRIQQRTGNTNSAKSFAAKYLKLNPYELDFTREYIELLLLTSDNDTDKALTQAETIFRNNAEILKLRGKYYSIIEQDNKKALKLYQQALILSPADPELNNYLSYYGLTPSTPLTEITDLAEYVEESKVDTVFENAESAYVLTESYDKLNADGTRSHSEHNVIKIFSSNAATNMKRYPIWYDKETETTQVVQAKVLHNNGESSIAQTSHITHPSGKGLTLLDFPALAAGDILEIEFTVNQIKPNFFGSYFGHIQRFSNSLPTVLSRYILSAPKSQKLYFHNNGKTPLRKVREEEQRTVYSWELRNIPAIDQQAFSAPAKEVSPTIEISTFKDWNELGKWYWELVESQNQPSSEIAAKVGEITFGSTTEREKLNAIYNWITTEVRNNAWEFGVHGYKPYNASTIFNRRFGDCKDKATLLNVMAKIAGLEAWPLLLRTTLRDGQTVSRGDEDLTLPLLGHFNHCISYVIADDVPYFLDSTMQLRTIDSNPISDAGAKAIIVRPQSAELTQTPPPSGDANRWIDYTGIGINAEGTADIDFTVATTGESSMYLRAWFGNPASWDNVLRAIASERYGHVSAVVVEDFGTNETLDKDEVMLKGRVRIRNYARTTTGKKILFSILEPFLSDNAAGRGAFPSRLSNYTIASKRDTDLLLPALNKIERHIKIEWPERWKIAEKLPADVDIDQPFGSLHIEYALINNTLKLDYVVEFKKTRISSAEYTDFRKFCLKADQPLQADFTLEPAE